MNQNAEDLRRFVGHLLAQYSVPVTLITQDLAHMGATLAVYRAYLSGRDMRGWGKGRILQLGSTAAYTPSPQMAVYSATKSFMLSFSEVLSNELRDNVVTVAALCPGATDTDFFERAVAENANAA